MNFVYTLCSSTPGQIQYGGFKRALAKKVETLVETWFVTEYAFYIYYFYGSTPCLINAVGRWKKLGGGSSSDEGTSAARGSGDTPPRNFFYF